MKSVLLLAGILALLACGCSMPRYVEVRAPRIQAESPQPNGLTAALAADLFRDVATQLGFVVVGPIQVSTNLFEYSARAPGKRPENKTSLTMWVDNKQIRFESGIVGYAKDLDAAQKVAALFEQALDKRGISYKLSSGKMIIRP